MAMKFYTEEEALDKVIGPKESAERIEYDARMDEFLIGEAIRQARKARNLTQEKAESLKEYVLNTNSESNGRYFADLFITDVVIR